MLRIVCFGFVDKNSGSVASAGFIVLKSLLESGVQVDFLGVRNFMNPTELNALPGYRYIPIDYFHPNPLGLLPKGKLRDRWMVFWNMWAYGSVEKEVTKC